MPEVRGQHAASISHFVWQILNERMLLLNTYACVHLSWYACKSFKDLTRRRAVTLNACHWASLIRQAAEGNLSGEQFWEACAKPV